jgi:serine/threonine-protein kinase
MPGPSPPDSFEIALDPDDAITVPPEEHTTSQTRRLGSNLAAAAELGVRRASGTAPAVVPPPAAATAMLWEDGPSWDGTGKPAGKPYLAGDVIDGKYRLTRIIGRGGMGAVWQAHNIPLDIAVAIKLIRRDRTAPGAGERLLTEARAAARLMHPAIVRVFDFGETSQGDPFIVMELLRGESLNAILRRKKRLTPQVAVQTLLPVAAALASAHGKGIVHRDLKPDNIILVTDESGSLVPKIVDFGIAKLLSPDVDRHVTMAGEVLGSPDYMSPEQARGADNVGEASDIWTFSVVLYELVAGRRPFDGLNYNALISSILTETCQPLTALGVGDAALSGIIEHGLTKDVASRWPRIRDMGAALASWAVANGVEDDVMGNSIKKQWLSGAARRLMTVQPETGEAPLRSGLVEPAPTPSWAAHAIPPMQGVAPVHGVSVAPPAAPMGPPTPPASGAPVPAALRPVAPASPAPPAPVASAAPAALAPPPPPPAPAAPPAMAPPMPPPPRAFMATMIHPSGRATSIDERRTSARRAVALVIGMVVLGAVAVAVFLLRDKFAALRAGRAATETSASAVTVSAAPSPVAPPPVAPTAASPTATAAAAPTAGASTASVAPSASAAASASAGADDGAAVPSADPSAAPSAKPSAWRYPRKNRAPAAPKNIKF